MRTPTYRDTPLFEAHALRALGCLVPIPFVAQILFALAGAMKSRSPRSTQKARNMVASEIVEAVTVDEPIHSGFVFYARPFAADHKSTISAASWRHAHDARLRVLDFETALTDMWWDYAPVVGLKTTEGSYGAGWVRVTEEGEWINLAKKLIFRASTILLLPGDTPGVVSEYRLIVSANRLARAVFVMPPSVRRYQAEAASEWSRVALLVLEQFGWQFPCYDARGRLFMLSAAGEVTLSTRLSWRHTLNGMRYSISRFRKACRAARDAGTKCHANV